MIPAHLRLALPALALALAAGRPEGRDPTHSSRPSVQRLVHVAASDLTPSQRAELVGRFDVSGRYGDRFEVIATDAELQRLSASDIPYDVAVEDIVAFYASRLSAQPTGSTGLGANLDPPFAQGSMGGFYTFDEVVSVLDQLAAQYPSIVAPRVSLGSTVEGRDLWALKVSDAPGVDEPEPEARFDSLHHAREPQSMQSTLWFLLFLLENYGTDPLATYLVDEREIWFVPVVNPDGYVHNESIAPGGGGVWRKNRRNNGDGTFGVDLNRNYPFQWGYDDLGSSPFTSDSTYRGPSPASEPETQAMVAFLAAREFGTALTSHTHSAIWLSPFGYDTLLPANNDDYLEVGALATETSGYEYGSIADTLYLANGSTVDQDHGVHGTMSWTPEIGGSNDGHWPPSDRIVPLSEQTLLGFQRTALASGAWARLSTQTPMDAGDGDGAFEAGEAVDFDLVARNSGVLAVAGDVQVSLSTTSPWASVTDAAHAFGSIGSFDEAVAGNVSLELDAGTPAGTAVPYSLELTYEGFVQRLRDEIVVGVPVAIAHDALEVDFGWTAGLPGDGAVTGLWERDDPTPTLDGGELVSPGDDASPAPGTDCFVTGNVGILPGIDDVDGGPATLLSPVLDLSGMGPGAQVRYARWFVTLDDPDDSFEVSISDDGGGSWTPLETVVGQKNEWTTSTFRVSAHVDQTDAVQLRFVASDEPDNSITEAAVDELEVLIYDDVPRLGLYGSASQGTPVAFHVTGEPGAVFNTFASLGTARIPLGFGDLLLDPLTLFFVYGGVVPAGGSSQAVFTVGGGPGLPGTTVYFQALVVDGPNAWMTNRAVTTIQP